MTIEHALYTLLVTPLAFTDSRNQLGARDDLSELPQVAFKRVSSPALDDDPGRWERWRFFIRADSYNECETIAATIYDTIQRGAGTVTDGADSLYIDWTSFIDLPASPDKQPQGYYETFADVRIIWRSS